MAYLITAVLVSPVIGAFLGLTIADVGLLYFMDFESWISNLPTLLLSNLSIAIGGGIVFGIPVVLVYGLPVFLVLKKLNYANVWVLGLFGALPTVIVSVFISHRNEVSIEAHSILSISRSALVGILTACVFWCLAAYLPTRLTKADDFRTD